MWREGDSLWVKVGVSVDIIKYIVPKGFVAIDGTSLTICEVNNTDKDGGPWFTFMLIAHTQECIIVPQKKIGTVRTCVRTPHSVICVSPFFTCRRLSRRGTIHAFVRVSSRVCA